MPDTNETVSVSERIRLDLERQILSGALKPDDRIPLERELMEIYACSRMTVNKAVSDLASRGLIVRRKRAGSFVAHPPSDSTILDIPDIRLDLERKGYAYAYRLLHRSVRAAKGAEETALAGKGGRVIELRGVHKADGQPFGYERRLVNLAAVPEVEAADFSTMPPGTWLLGHVPWSQAEHRIFAVAADAGIAAHLGIAEGTPCLMLERRTWLNGMPVTHVWQTFPGDRHSFIGALTRRQA
jgi:GntR family histidine utilization transcriptional repressor